MWLCGGWPRAPESRSSKSQNVAENPTRQENPIAEKYDTLVMRVYFRDRAERDDLAQELNAEEVPTTGAISPSSAIAPSTIA